jgi:hypothetical protein
MLARTTTKTSRAARIYQSLSITTTRFTHSISKEQLSPLVNSFDPTIPVERALTAPSSWYIDKNFYEAERKAVFGNNWVAVGHTHHLKQAGDFISGVMMGEPWIVSARLIYLYFPSKNHLLHT